MGKKEIMIIQSSFSVPHVVPNLYASLSSVEHEDILRNTGNQTTLEPIDCYYMAFCVAQKTENQVWSK